MTHQLLESKQVQKIRIIWALLGYFLGVAGGLWAGYINFKTPDSAYTESLAQQLRECEETLDIVPPVDTP